MAKITGVQSGLIVTEASWETPKYKERKRPQPKLPTECECTACGARWVVSARSSSSPLQDPEGRCKHCSMFFGSMYPGVTSASPEEAMKKMAGLKEDKFLMIQRELHMAAKDGNQIEIGAGDIFACNPSTWEPDPSDYLPKKERTWGMFTLQLQVGPYEVTLFPHEWAPIPFVKVMEFKKAGEIVESFMSTNDNAGHFTPRADIKEQIDEIFGHLTGARKSLAQMILEDRDETTRDITEGG